MRALKQWLRALNLRPLKEPAKCRFFYPLFQAIAIVCMAWASLLPQIASALSVEDARHLLTRTGFDPNWSEIEPFLALSKQEAVNKIVSGATTQPVIPFPNDLLTTPEDSLEVMMSRTGAERDAAQRLERMRLESLQGWWVSNMIQTKHPLAEQMTLFWSNHFTSSIQKVRTTRLMAQQHQTIRKYGLDNFSKLLPAMIKDPAMLRYLDSANNRKEHPNENFARELLELFTLGTGHYTERDVQEASRAFTGWMIDRERAAFHFNLAYHDNGNKTFFGKTGNLDGNDIVEQLLKHPATAEFIVGKLWRFFIDETPDNNKVRFLAQRWQQQHHYAIKPLLVELLMQDDFWVNYHRGTIIKSPVEFVVSLARVWRLPINKVEWTQAISQLGQDLFNPPSVKGWDGGTTWITTNTLLRRQQHIKLLLDNNKLMANSPMPTTWNNATQALWQKTLLALPPSQTANLPPKQQIHEWLLDPVYQVK